MHKKYAFLMRDTIPNKLNITNSSKWYSQHILDHYANYYLPLGTKKLSFEKNDYKCWKQSNYPQEVITRDEHLQPQLAACGTDRTPIFRNAGRNAAKIRKKPQAAGRTEYFPRLFNAAFSWKMYVNLKRLISEFVRKAPLLLLSTSISLSTILIPVVC